MKYATELIEVLVAVVVFGALFPQINTAITALGLDNISVAGTTRDFGFIGYILVLGLLFGVMWIGVAQMKKK